MFASTCLHMLLFVFLCQCTATAFFGIIKKICEIVWHVVYHIVASSPYTCHNKEPHVYASAYSGGYYVSCHCQIIHGSNF